MRAASILHTDATRALVEEAFRSEEHGVDWRSGAAGAVAAVAPLAVGVGLADAPAGLTAAIGALNAALVVPKAGLRSRVVWGAAFVVAGAGSLMLADAVEPRPWLLVLATLVWIGTLAVLRAAGRVGALAGFAASAVFVVFGGVPPGPETLSTRLLWYALGAVPAAVLLVCARRGPATLPVRGRDVARGLADGLRRDARLRAHALRLGVAVAGATLLERTAALDHGYWVPLTVLAVLQPSERATRVRVVQRAAGTLVGAAMIVAVTSITSERWALVACTSVAAFWLYALDERGYFWLVVLLTPTVLLMLSAADFQGDEIAIERVANSMLGIAIGLAIGELTQAIGSRRAG